MDKLLLIDEIKLQISDQTYIDIMSSMREIHHGTNGDDEDQLHSIDDLPSKIFKYNHSIIKNWHQGGQLHRGNDQPAMIETINNLTQRTEWYQIGQLHRDNDQPTVIEYDHLDGHI